MGATELPEEEMETEAETGPEAEGETQTFIPRPAPLAGAVGHSRDSSTADHWRNGAAIDGDRNLDRVRGRGI
jgi:hypothetical protein